MGKVANISITIVAITIAISVWIFGIQVVRVSGHSMDTTLHNGQFGVSTKFEPNKTKLSRNQIIIFDGSKEDPKDSRVDGPIPTDFIKRVIGVPGDRIKFDGKDVYVNDKKIDQPYLSAVNHTVGTASQDLGTWTLDTLSKQDTWKDGDQNTNTVPKDAYFVMGDNRTQSEDSRYFGYVHKQSIKAVLYKSF